MEYAGEFRGGGYGERLREGGLAYYGVRIGNDFNDL
jgi:hypothetical protein